MQVVYIKDGYNTVDLETCSASERQRIVVMALHGKVELLIHASLKDLRQCIRIVSNNVRNWDYALAEKTTGTFVGDEARKIILNWTVDDES